MQVKEKMAFNPDLVNAIEDAITSLEHAQTDGFLADHLGECHALHARLGKAIADAKARVIERGGIVGTRYEWTVKGVVSRVLDQAGLAHWLELRGIKLDHFKTDRQSIRVNVKSLY